MGAAEFRLKKVLMPLPKKDFDPTEAAVPWRTLSRAGVQIYFATSDGGKATCDDRMISGDGLGVLAPLLVADKNAQAAYEDMIQCSEFRSPLKWENAREVDFDGLILPGGHAPGMKEYLESPVLQSQTAAFFERGKPVGAICHGVVLVARSKCGNGQSVLYGRKTTSLLQSQELLAWNLTRWWLGDYYRTYPQTVEAEVRQSLQAPQDFLRGPLPLSRDSDSSLSAGFAVCDENYVSARWPGDAHLFARKFLERLLT
ncbi:glutamine amidotransferase [Bdellovibrio bacteriovorus]|uniref:Glutamine amidotransferase n=2 Tax=Bdellovibrio bacteriovorus TaxID=959 RepID=A0A161PRD7_BDEBC|nr:glutamine amidotransferase [Bdellovibrio bacteriovorus]